MRFHGNHCILTLALVLVGCGQTTRAPEPTPPVVIAPEVKPPEPVQHIFRMPRDQMNDLATSCGFDRQTLNNSMRFQMTHYDFDWVVDAVWARDVKKIYVCDDVNDADEHFRIDYKDCTIFIHADYHVF